MHRRQSLFGPLLLILLGTLLLVHNFSPDFPFWDLVGRYWPVVLVVWGLAKLAEALRRPSAEGPWRPSLSIGEFFLAMLLVMVGLAASYNILLVDQANRLWRAGASREAAIREACLIRLRPIFMTSLAAILGLLPMSLHPGEPGMPLARAMIGGLAGAQLMTLVMTPALYRILKPGSVPEDPYAEI